MDRLREPGAAAARITVVIPVLREHAALERLLADLRSQSRVPDEVVIVGGARDAQVADVAQRNAARLIDSHACRGMQLDAGALAANADVLWFVHADARLPQHACADVLEAVASGAAGGCLRFEFQSPRPLIARVIERLVRVRLALGGIAYGDQALFCTRRAYRLSGGYPHVPLFEEVPLVRHLQRTQSFAALPTPVYVSARRWQRDGWLRRSLHNRWLALRHGLGATPATLGRAYEPPRGGASVGATHTDITQSRG